MTQTIRDKLLPTVDKLRQLPNRFGIRRYTVTIRRRTWSGGAPGRGVATDADTVLFPVPRVRVMSTDEIAASGGTYREGDFVINAITPSYGAGGYTPAQLNLRPNGPAEDVTVILTGDEGTVECDVVQLWFHRAFNYHVVVRARRTAVGTTGG